MMGVDLAAGNLPVILIGSLLFIAILSFLLRGWGRIIAIIGAVVASGWSYYLWSLDLDTQLHRIIGARLQIDTGASIDLLGFILRLEPTAVPIISVSLGLAAVAFLFSIPVGQGRSFVPLTLALTSGYIALALLTVGPLAPALVAPLLLAILTVIGVFMLQAGRQSSAAGPIRSMIPPLLAFPLFLLASWYIDQIPLNPQDISPAYAAAQMIALGLIIILAPMPLHGALPSISKNSPPIVAALLTLLYQLAVLHLVFRTVNNYQFVHLLAPLSVWFTWAGLLTAVWGGFAGAGTRNAGRLVGYSSMHDWGLIILVLAMPGNRSWPLVLFMFGLRSISLMTASFGLAVMEKSVGSLDWSKLEGAGTRLPWNSAALLIGGLGLCGFPLSAGFTGHWAALQVVAESDWRPAAVVLIASAGTILGFIRLARVLFGPLEDRSIPRETSLSIALAVLALVVTFSFAFAPQLLDNPINRAMIAFSG